MFLGWISQLLVLVDTSNVDVVASIILRIAHSYPQSIMYAYRLSKENYKTGSMNIDASVLIEKFVRITLFFFGNFNVFRLDKLLLSDHRINLFLKALASVSVPVVVLLYHVRKLLKAKQSGDNNLFKTVQTNVLIEVFSGNPDSKDVNYMQGNMFKRIASYKKAIEGLAGREMEIFWVKT